MGEKITAKVETITPEIAKTMLGENVNNRRISRDNVNLFAREIRNGEWRFNGEAIKFGKDGRLLDGQHRLLAVIAADKPLTTLVIRGLEDETQQTMDSGKTRTLGDVLTLRGEKKSTQLASLARAVYLADQLGMEAAAQNDLKPTRGEIISFIDQTPQLADVLAASRAFRSQSGDTLTDRDHAAWRILSPIQQNAPAPVEGHIYGLLGMLDMSLTKDQEVAPANRTVTITVTVGEPDTPVEPSITGIRVKSEPTKTKYTVGEQFSADGLVIEATMSDGTVKTLDAADYTVGDVDMSAVGTKTVTVTLKANDQLTTSFVVTVSAKTEPGKPGSGDGSGDGAGSDNGNAGTGADSGLPSSGAAVLGLGGAVVVLAVAGISLTIWRKRRA